MTFDELVLHNFGVYRGRHSLDLSPLPGKPVILIGALNGAGKTTILDALQLVLYGKLARSSNRGNTAYETYLRRCINRSVPADEGACIELKFRHSTESGEERVRIRRAWRQVGKGIKETLQVERDGKRDPFYEEHWHQHVDEFIPARLSNLFFFDGEKIEYFAEPENAAELLRTGSQALLGLDLVEQLHRDLEVVARRRSRRHADRATREQLNDLDQQLESLHRERERLTSRKAEEQNTKDQLEKKLSSLTEAYRRDGGELFDQREQIEQAANIAKREVERMEGTLRDLASGDAPLLLVSDLLAECRAQAEREHTAQQQSSLLDELKSRDREIERIVSQYSLREDGQDALRAYLERDHAQREAASESDIYLHVSPADLTVTPEQLEQTQGQIQMALSEHEHVTEELLNQQRNLASIPQPEKFQSHLADMDQARNDLDAVESRLGELEAQLRHITHQIESLRDKRVKIEADNQLALFAEQTSHRLIEESGILRRTIERYQVALAERHLHRLERLIVESLQHLLRKERLITDVRVDAITYELSLADTNGNRLHPDRLSAGERQLLAIALVWALTRASGKPLPAVIDTPLGRLDGSHRDRVVESYFPQASHQVLLLSTDQEISGGYYAQLRDSTAKEYQLIYDDIDQTTTIMNGYPWVEVA